MFLNKLYFKKSLAFSLWSMGVTVALAATANMAIHPSAMAAVDVTDKTIAAAVQAHVTQALGETASLEKASVRVDIQKISGGPIRFEKALQESDIQIETHSMLAQQYNAMAIVRVILTDHVSGQSRILGVPIRIHIEKPVWVTKSKLVPGEMLSCKNLAVQVQDVSHSFKNVLGEETDLSPYEARVVMLPGQVLDKRMVIVPPAVRRNSEVHIVMSNGQGLEIATLGIALEDGQIGQRIRIRQRQFKNKTYTATVVSRNKALIAL